MARGRLIVLLAGLAVCGAVACGSQSNAPLGKGDTVYVDVEASALPPDQPDAYIAASPFAPVDGSDIYGSNYGDASTPVLSVCSPPDGSAGAVADGATSTAPDASASAAADGSASAAAGSASDAGAACTAFPAACMSQPDCVCLFGAFKAQIPCPYPSCGVLKDGFDIYCPP
jgi:hypothetical protein